jgi:hypothetical protein
MIMTFIPLYIFKKGVNFWVLLVDTIVYMVLNVIVYCICFKFQTFCFILFDWTNSYHLVIDYIIYIYRF